MSTDPRIDPPDEQPEAADDQETDDGVEFADTEDREQTDASFREKGREIMEQFRGAFASLAE
jgi:hypothetical protein